MPAHWKETVTLDGEDFLVRHWGRMRCAPIAYVARIPGIFRGLE